MPDTFVLWRIIGNDLFPRHERGQSRKNLAFILENEPDLLGCQKRFIVNRIVDPNEERLIIEMLERTGYPYIRIPFDWNEYRQLTWDTSGVPSDYAPYTESFAELPQQARHQIEMRIFRHKNNYVMNNNGARNVALREGKKLAKWVLPWDGNCYLTGSAWRELRSAVISKRDVPYHIVSMARITENSKLLDKEYMPEAAEEPQILFRADSKSEFNEDYSYGRRPKVELLWRLGVPGTWDRWPIEPWDLACPPYSSEAGQFTYSGWVARLYSGKANLEKQKDHKALVGRGEARMEAVGTLLSSLDAKVLESSIDSDLPVFSNPSKLSDASSCLLGKLRTAANQAMSRGPYSVVDKKTLPPSQNPHDYWHAAPYYWPHPLKLPGLPYIRRDGLRVPGTRLYEPQSDNYDRTRLQRLFDDTYVLALGWRNLGDDSFGRHAAALVKHWFLEPSTAMNPHLEFAQVRKGHNRNRGASTGIIEFKDFYYFLDAVRILRSGRFLNQAEVISFENWLGEYLHWLSRSEQGFGERSANNNHGTYYDLQVAAISLFLGEHKILRRTLRDSRFRILEQFDSDGAQPHELARTTSAHYCCFNLQGWIHLAMLAEYIGEDLWSFTGRDGQSIRKGMEWLISYINKPWPFKQIDTFDKDRFLPILLSFDRKYGRPSRMETFESPSAEDLKPLFYPHDGIRPFWNIEMISTRNKFLKFRKESFAL
ncbi:alginate lyase family protein [Microbulbifer elongatus]|uniref:alginate lyase family protein n=1 Tax=Microbulbifer elongatus TaxID=86173 RepID=UPI001E38296A|nr:alginate lyase family protein [Microbulbifer elongatus]